MTNVYSRQRLYDVNHKEFIKAVISGSINKPCKGTTEEYLEQDVANKFFEYSGINNLIPLSRGRLAAYFCIKHSVTSKRKKVIMSPFTIFDLVNMVRVGGGVPFFIDSEPESPHVSLRSLKEAIDEETAVVIITHYHSSNREIKEIAEYCRSKGVILIEDCAISLGSRVDGAHVGSFGDYALFSFGLFKFVSTYFGGGVVVKDPQKRQIIIDELNTWPRMSTSSLLPYAKKGWKLSLLTNQNVFQHFTFPIFRFGYINNIEFIKSNAQNDPDPLLRNFLPEEFKMRPSLFQMREFIRQIPNVEHAREKRVSNACLYYENMKKSGIVGLPDIPDRAVDCYLNFPLLISGNRDEFVKEMMRSGFDLAIYYYRNCAEIEAFKEYYKYLPNIKNYVDALVFFPTYPTVSSSYIDKLTNRAAELLK